MKGAAIEAVFDGQKEWFLRLDFCSTKDARGEGGKKDTSSIRKVEDVLQRRCASKRAARAMGDIILKKAPGPARLFFIPHNKDMDTSRELRVLCPPLWSLSALSNKHRREVTSSLHPTKKETARVAPWQDAIALSSPDNMKKAEKQRDSVGRLYAPRPSSAD